MIIVENLSATSYKTSYHQQLDSDIDRGSISKTVNVNYTFYMLTCVEHRVVELDRSECLYHCSKNIPFVYKYVN